jgi:carboxyl-terminal processing protease
MPRRNLLVLLAAVLAALLCYPRVQKSPYGAVLAGAMSEINREYLHPIDGQSLFEGAMDGMMGRLDQNSLYISPDDLEDFHKEIDQEFVGMGVKVDLDPRTKQLTVFTALTGSPAHRAGILAGDRILKIGKKSTQDMSLGDAVGLLLGKPGEPLTLTVLHSGESKPVEITLVRELIHWPTVIGDLRNPDGSWNFFLDGHDRIGYVRITSFTEKTAEELEKALRWLADRDMRGLVLDLRDDPGGYLDAAVDVCDMLIESGVIVTTRGRDGRARKTYTADGNGRYTDFPMAVLVNERSASAAEIVAACLQDHHRAAIIGERSFGKGTIQKLLELDAGCGAMKLTTSSYWRPSGKTIQRPPEADAKAEWGVSPDSDCAVPLSAEEATRWRTWRAERDVLKPSGDTAKIASANAFADRPLQRAIEWIDKESSAK